MPHALQNLSHRHRMAVALKLDGMKHAKIAEELGTTRNVVDGWMKDPLVKEEMERQSANIIERINGKRLAAVNAALEVSIARIQAPGVVGAATDNPELVQYDELPIDEGARRTLLLRLLDLDSATMDPKHSESPGNGSRGLGDGMGEGGVTNVMTIIGGMTPEQVAEAQRRAQDQAEAIEATARPKKK